MTFKTTTFFLLLCIPFVALSDGLTDPEIDKFLSSIKEISEQMDQMQKQVDPEISKQIGAASLEGNMLRTMVTLVKDEPDFPVFKSTIETAGYEDLDNWAYIGDRIFSIYGAAQFVHMSNSMSLGEEVVPEGANMFALAKDESLDEEARTLINKQLQEMCEKMCVVQEDLEPVGNRFDEVQAAFSR